MLSPVGSTACWVAASRALESEAPDALFNDPYARALSGDTGFEMLKAALSFQRAGNSRSPYVVIRTRFIDDLVNRVVREEGMRQVVLLAAGLDARAFRFDWPSDLRWFEVDRGEIFDHKESVLTSLDARTTCDRKIVPADLEHDWVSPLTAAGFDRSRPAFFVVEGLVMYLERAPVERLFETMSTVAAPGGSRFVADLTNDDMLTSPYTRPMMEALEKMGCPWRFSTSKPKPFFERFGWDVTVNTPGDPDVGRGRWPYPTVPDSVPGVPRTYFVSGRR